MSKCYVFVKVEHAEDQLTCRTQIFVLKCQQTYLVVIQVKKNIYLYIFHFKLFLEEVYNFRNAKFKYLYYFTK